MTLPTFDYANPKTIQEALAQLGGEWADATLYAGGVDLLDLMKERVVTPKKLVNLKRIPGLNEVTFDEKEGTRIGPLVTLAQVAAQEELGRLYPALTAACGLAATPPIRNLATLGGNLCQRPRCWYLRSEDFPCLRKGGSRCYAKDGENRYHAIFTENEPCVIVHPSAAGTALVALGGAVEITGPQETRSVPAEKFFLRSSESLLRENVLRPSEIITAITIPADAADWKSVYLKQREKQAYDWPLADVAVAVRLDGSNVGSARVVLGSAAPVPWRALAAEEFLAGKALTEETCAEAGRLAVEGAKPLSQNAYKVQLFKVLVRRALLAAAMG